MAPEGPSGVAIDINFTQLVETLEQCHLVLGLDAENSIVSETFGKGPTSSCLVFHPPLSTLNLNFFFNELAFETVHGLLYLLLGRNFAL